MKINQPGYSLLEVLLGMLLLSFGLMAAAPMFVYAMRATAAGADMGSVGAMAVEQMEQLRSQDYFSLAAGGSVTSDVTGYFDNSDPDYLVRWQIVANATTPVGKTITMRVIAQRQVMGQPKEVTLVTRRAP